MVAGSGGLAGVCQPAVAFGASGWVAPVNLAEEKEEVLFGPYVGMDAQGDSLAVWDGGSATNESFRSAGGAWQAPGSLAAEHPTVGGRCFAMSSQGEALALRSTVNAKGELVIQAVMKPSGGVWQAPVEVAPAAPNALGMTGCRVAIDPAGDAVAVWSFETEFEFEPVWAAYKPAGGSWMAPVELRPPLNPAASPDVAIDSHGDAQAVWIGNSFVIQGAYKPAGEDWREPKSVTEVESLSEKGHSALDPQVAFDSAGDAVAAWSIGPAYGSEKEESVVQATSRQAGGAWQPPIDLSQGGQEAEDPQLASDSLGDALAVWDLHSGANWIVQSAGRPTGEEWHRAVNLSEAGGNAYNPEVAMDGSGDAVAAWEAQAGKEWRVQSVVKASAGDWQAPVGLSETTAHGDVFPQVAIDAQGDALAAWQLYNGTAYLIQAADYRTEIAGKEGGSSTTTPGEDQSTGIPPATGPSATGSGLSQQSPPTSLSSAFRIVHTRTERDGKIVLELECSAGRLSSSASVPAPTRTTAHTKTRHTILYGKGSAKVPTMGVVTLTVVPRHTALIALRRSKELPRELHVLVTVTFTPAEGASRTETHTVIARR